jgi:hypothetical protein
MSGARRLPIYSGSSFRPNPFCVFDGDRESFLRFDGGISKPAELPSDGQGQSDNSSTHSWIFFDASVARRPNDLSLTVAASILALNLPDGFVKASRVVAGERSARRSSPARCLVGDREGARVCALGGAIRGIGRERSGDGGSSMVGAVC